MTATETPHDAKPAGRRRGRLVLIGVGIMVAALAVGVLAGTLINEEPAASTVAGPSTSAAPSPTAGITPAATPSAASTANQANGCLGGSDTFAAILPAQQAASLDAPGAAAFARTAARWMVTFPSDPAAQQVLDQLASSDNPGYRQNVLDQQAETAREFRTQGYIDGRVVADSGSYRVARDFLDNRGGSVDVIVNRQLTRNDGRVETVAMVTTFVLTVENDKWHLYGTIPSINADPFAEDPGNPWQSYSGAC